VDSGAFALPPVATTISVAQRLAARSAKQEKTSAALAAAASASVVKAAMGSAKNHDAVAGDVEVCGSVMRGGGGDVGAFEADVGLRFDAVFGDLDQIG
jgi:hypothetical protein